LTRIKAIVSGFARLLLYSWRYMRRNHSQVAGASKFNA
jgi:hypothetical protein